MMTDSEAPTQSQKGNTDVPGQQRPIHAGSGPDRQIKGSGTGSPSDDPDGANSDCLEIEDKPREANFFARAAFVFALVTTLLGVLGYRDHIKTRQEGREIQVQLLLDQAWDLVGGHPGTEAVINEIRCPPTPLSKLVEADRLIVQALSLEPLNLRAHLIKGHILHTQGDFKGAAAVLEIALSRDSESIGGNLGLGSALLRLNQPELARDYFSKVLHLERNTEAYNNIGVTYLASGENERALDNFKRAVEESPRNAAAFSNIGVASSRLNRGAEAERAFRHAIELDEAPGSLLAYAQFLIDAMRFEESLAAAKIGIETWPECPKFYFLAGTAQKSLQSLAAAKESFSKAIELDPRYDLAYLRLGNVLMANRELDASLEVLRQATLANPESAEAYNSIGVVYRMKGELEESERMFRKAVVTNQDFLTGRRNLGFILVEQGRMQEAETEFLRLAEMDQRDPGVYETLAQIYRATGQPLKEKAALDVFRTRSDAAF